MFPMKDGSNLFSLRRKKEHLDLSHGAILPFKVLDLSEKDQTVELSLRQSRMDGSLDDDNVPEIGDIAQAYVIDTNKKGCFVRYSRNIDGRCILKELSDGFLLDPAASFPSGRLVVGKVTAAHEEGEHWSLDMNLKESAVADAKKLIDLRDIEVGQKFHGTVSRIEDYGVFVQLEGSSVFGLVHKSECSDRFIKDVSKVYSPGDLVKVYVLKKDASKKQVGLSMKASYFNEEDKADENHSDAEKDNFDDASVESAESAAVNEKMDVEAEDESASDDDDGSDDDDNDDNKSDTSDESQESEEESEEGKFAAVSMDMDVGFEWSAGAEPAPVKDDDGTSSGESDSDDDEASTEKGNHSRKNRSSRRREEKQISEREKALADGTADENPETAGDYERLVTSHPNSSELWIRYMAFHLSLADLDAARKVAERALERIEFREEREKLNVWCALLTLEIKYGTKASVDETIKRACAQSNPKQVHLRVCEIMEKELEQGGEVTRERVDDMYAVTCKKFKSKKKVWITHAAYLLRSGKFDEALAVSKRALLSLPSYKHTEMMSRMAQLLFEHDRAEQARTVFDGLLAKNPKRLDLFSVYVDKEVKHGDKEHARQLFKDVAGTRNSSRSMKLSEKQMKKLFKRWYTFEENHGTEETCEAVKQAAIEYVEGR